MEFQFRVPKKHPWVSFLGLAIPFLGADRPKLHRRVPNFDTRRPRSGTLLGFRPPKFRNKYLQKSKKLIRGSDELALYDGKMNYRLITLSASA